MNELRDSVLKYYNKSESRIGYRLLLDGVRHYGWYPTDGSVSRWSFRSAQRKMELVLGERLRLPAGARVLDAGCGEGHVARTIAEEFGLHVHGIDLVAQSIELAKASISDRGLSDRLNFSIGDYHNLNYPDGFFDGVYTMETFVHAADPARVLSEFYRVLRPGGTAVLIEYSSASEEMADPDAYAALRTVCKLAAMPTWLKLEFGSMENFARVAGFEISTVEDLTANMLPMLSAFSCVARLPFAAISAFGMRERAVNAMSAVELFRYQDVWRYCLYVLRKPR